MSAAGVLQLHMYADTLPAPDLMQALLKTVCLPVVPTTCQVQSARQCFKPLASVNWLIRIKGRV